MGIPYEIVGFLSVKGPETFAKESRMVADRDKAIAAAKIMKAKEGWFGVAIRPAGSRGGFTWMDADVGPTDERHEKPKKRPRWAKVPLPMEGNPVLGNDAT